MTLDRAFQPGAAVEPATEFATYAAVREAFFNNRLSRTFDRRAFADGNIREGVVSTSHGELHRARRRLENAQFRAEILRAYEREQAPIIVAEILDAAAREPAVDLYRVAIRLSLVLASARLGIDLDRSSTAQLDLFEREADGLAQMSEIVDSKDPERTREVARHALAAWTADFMAASIQRRLALLRRFGPTSTELPSDLLTALLLHRAEPELAIVDDALIVREIATYVVGALHTNAMTLINAVDFLSVTERPGVREKIAADPGYAQRWIHETLRLRPNTPRPKRYAEEATTIAGQAIPMGAIVALNVARANRDTAVFGDDASRFDPDRLMPEGVARWGLSFGAGAHQCPGRSYAGGFPLPNDLQVEPDHLYGVVPLMLQDLVRRGVAPDPERRPVPDDRTERYTWWQSYPIILNVPLPG